MNTEKPYRVGDLPPYVDVVGNHVGPYHLGNVHDAVIWCDRLNYAHQEGAAAQAERVKALEEALRTVLHGLGAGPSMTDATIIGNFGMLGLHIVRDARALLKGEK